MDLKARTFEDTVVLSPAGRIDHNTADAFQSALMTHIEACGQSGAAIVLDLGAIDYMSSVGLRVLMVAAKQSKKDDGKIVVAAMQPDMQEIFEISRFNFVYEAFDTVADALATVSSTAANAYSAAEG